MEAQEIKIELEMTPEMALFLSMYLNSTAQGDLTLQKLVSSKGRKAESLSIR
jgi:hypothetical protein